MRGDKIKGQAPIKLKEWNHKRGNDRNAIPFHNYKIYFLSYSSALLDILSQRLLGDFPGASLFKGWKFTGTYKLVGLGISNFKSLCYISSNEIDKLDNYDMDSVSDIAFTIYHNYSKIIS